VLLRLLRSREIEEVVRRSTLGKRRERRAVVRRSALGRRRQRQ